MTKLSDLSVGELIVRIRSLRRSCDGYQEKIDLILIDACGGAPTRQLLLRLRDKKAALEKEIKALRRRLGQRRRTSLAGREMDDARDSD